MISPWVVFFPKRVTLEGCLYCPVIFIWYVCIMPKLTQHWQWKNDLVMKWYCRLVCKWLTPLLLLNSCCYMTTAALYLTTQQITATTNNNSIKHTNTFKIAVGYKKVSPSLRGLTKIYFVLGWTPTGYRIDHFRLLKGLGLQLTSMGEHLITKWPTCFECFVTISLFYRTLKTP